MPRTQVFRQKRPYILIIARTFAFYKCFFAHAVSFWEQLLLAAIFSACSLCSACSTCALPICFFSYLFLLHCFYTLRAWHTQYRSTGVLGRQPREYIILYLVNRMGHAVPFYRRASDNLFGSGESASNDAYSLPSQRFSLALSFPQPSPLFWETSRLNSFHDFSRQISFLCVLCSIMKTCSFTSPSIGGWGRRKAGDWGRKPGRGRGIAAGLPPFPWVVSPRHR